MGIKACRNNNLIVIVFLYSLVMGCSWKTVLKSKNDNKINLLSVKIINDFGIITNQNDTILQRHGISLIYSGGKLKSAGSFQDGQKHGIWFEYSSSAHLSAILYFDNDSTFSTYILVQPRW